MQKSNSFVVSLIAILITAFSLTVYAEQTTSTKSKPCIALVATGGTIAGVQKSSDSASYKAGVITGEDIANSVKGLNEIATLKFYQPYNKASQDIDDADLVQLAKLVQKVADNPEIDGIVITHGTDTMEETAYFLDLVVNTHKPIVITGSMRPSTSISADGPLNLYNSVSVAASKEASGKGVLIVMDDEIQTARESTKTNTTNADTFKSLNTGNIGEVYYGKVMFYAESTRANTYKSPFNITEIQKLPKVSIVYGHVGGALDMIKAAVASGAKGIVYAGVGDGNIYDGDLKELEKARKDGIAVVISSRTGSGTVIHDDELNDTKYKFATSDNLNPEKARILLQVSLTKNNDYKDIQSYFDKY